MIAAPPTTPRVPISEVMFESDRLGASEVTVIVPLYLRSLRSGAFHIIRAQTLAAIDLVVIDDASKMNLSRSRSTRRTRMPAGSTGCSCFATA